MCYLYFFNKKSCPLGQLFLFFTQWYRLFSSIGLLGKRLRGFG
nr:MAG TPA: hypothetical protein [Caudoviricetes sp.]